MVYLETCRGPSAITLRLDVGSRIPLATTAMGRALVAAQPAAERARLLKEIERQDPKNATRMRRGLEQAVRQLGARGFVESIGDWQADVHAIGVPLIEPDGSVAFALTCGGAGFQLPQEKLEREIGPRLVALARTLGSPMPGSASPACRNR
jgi:DNA-binding IclR family transcriptional regulator